MGIKIWSDGSPWVGNAATSFPYLDTDVTRSLGLAGTRGEANYTEDEILEISKPYFENGWQTPAMPTVTPRSPWSSTRGSGCSPTRHAKTTDSGSSTSGR